MRKAAVVVALAASVLLAGCAASPTLHVVHKTAPVPRLTAAASVTYTANPTADQKAAAVLQTEDQTLSVIIGEGVQVIGKSGQVVWWNGPANPTTVETGILNAFKTADGFFTTTDTTTDEPPSMTTWRDTPLPGDMIVWYQSDTGSGPTAASTATVAQDLAALQTAAASVAQGK